MMNRNYKNEIKQSIYTYIIHNFLVGLLRRYIQDNNLYLTYSASLRVTFLREDVVKEADAAGMMNIWRLCTIDFCSSNIQ